MKCFLPFLAVVLSSFSSPGDPVERLGIKGPLSFGKTSFALAWTDKPNANYYVQEYLPAGETVERFTQLLTVNLFTKDVPLENAVQQKTAELDNRKKTDAVCHYAASKSGDGKEYIVDFLLSESRAGDMTVVEFNLYRYKRIEVNGKKALLVYAFSERAYGKATTAFLTALKKERPALLSAMAAAPLPAVKAVGE